MSLPHHGGPEEQRLKARLADQFLGMARREWPEGRVDGDDNGTLAFAIATDKKHRIIRIEFGKPVAWLGLDVQSAEELRDQLTQRLHELRGIPA